MKMWMEMKSGGIENKSWLKESCGLLIHTDLRLPASMI